MTRRYTARWLALASMLALVAPAAAAQAPHTASPLVGTWQVVEWWTGTGTSGERRYPLGRQPLGYFVYDASGRVFVQVVRPPADRLGEGRWRTLPADDLRKLLDRYVSYFGTYTADAARGILSEHIEDDLTREHAGTIREVPFRIDGDRLILGDGTSWQCVLMRAY